MVDKERNERLIKALMVLVLICLLLIGNSSVAFGQITRPQDMGYISGTIYYEDGITPLVIDNLTSDDHIELWDLTTNTARILYTDENGLYTSTSIPTGPYRVAVWYDGIYAGSTEDLTVVAGETITANVETSRIPKN
jgi:hypothetical protein